MRLTQYLVRYSSTKVLIIFVYQRVFADISRNKNSNKGDVTVINCEGNNRHQSFDQSCHSRYWQIKQFAEISYFNLLGTGVTESLGGEETATRAPAHQICRLNNDTCCPKRATIADNRRHAATRGDRGQLPATMGN